MRTRNELDPKEEVINQERQKLKIKKRKNGVQT
jgi:hypothetical protein